MVDVNLYLVVYLCTDDNEEEACFVEHDFDKAVAFCETASSPEGYEHRPGYYFIEPYERELLYGCYNPR